MIDLYFWNRATAKERVLSVTVLAWCLTAFLHGCTRGSLGGQAEPAGDEPLSAACTFTEKLVVVNRTDKYLAVEAFMPCDSTGNIYPATGVYYGSVEPCDSTPLTVFPGSDGTWLFDLSWEWLNPYSGCGCSTLPRMVVRARLPDETMYCDTFITPYMCPGTAPGRAVSTDTVVLR